MTGNQIVAETATGKNSQPLRSDVPTTRSARPWHAIWRFSWRRDGSRKWFPKGAVGAVRLSYRRPAGNYWLRRHLRGDQRRQEQNSCSARKAWLP